MGQKVSAESPQSRLGVVRGKAVTEGKPSKAKPTQPNVVYPSPEDWETIDNALEKVLLFARLDGTQRRQVVQRMYERHVTAGEIIIREGERGLAADEMYVVKRGNFEARHSSLDVLETRLGVRMLVNIRTTGDCFGELALFYQTARTATVAAVSDASVWVLDRATLRQCARESAVAEIQQVELFLNIVPILAPLTRDERLRIADALEEEVYQKGEIIIKQGEPGEHFFIVKEGEAVVVQSQPDSSEPPRKVNHLFRSDFFGEKALLTDDVRGASVVAAGSGPLVCLTLKRDVFLEVLGPLQALMVREKSDQVVSVRMAQLAGRWQATPQPIRLEHLQYLHTLGTGAFSVVRHVRDIGTNRHYALKRMRKVDLMNCSEHVYCEQAITRITAHPFIIRQYSSFQDDRYLYLLLDYVTGGDLMDALVRCAEVKSLRQGRFPCLSPSVDVLQGMKEQVCRFYVASLVLALEYLHSHGIVYRDLKPENVLLDASGFIKLGDFGFAKVLLGIDRTYTFCGTPGYVAPESILAKGYGTGVDWWGLGVVLYVLLTGRQPFGEPTEDPMVVMNRIVDPTFEVQYPAYLSPEVINLMRRMLERKPAKGRANDVKAHAWFDGLDWELLSARKLSPPHLPPIRKHQQKKMYRPEDDPEEEMDEQEGAQLEEANRVFADF
eukprot:jgi/Chlat1/457/Chrsp103S00975